MQVIMDHLQYQPTVINCWYGYTFSCMLLVSAISGLSLHRSAVLIKLQHIVMYGNKSSKLHLSSTLLQHLLVKTE
jgi:hypothetical protein